jgi:hypothetical protein
MSPYRTAANILIASVLAQMDGWDSTFPTEDERRQAAREGVARREIEERRRKEEYDAKATPFREERARKKREAWNKQHPGEQS